jgi:uncharacterized protein YjbJ (UPF0337 family)
MAQGGRHEIDAPVADPCSAYWGYAKGKLKQAWGAFVEREKKHSNGAKGSIATARARSDGHEQARNHERLLERDGHRAGHSESFEAADDRVQSCSA